MRKKQITGGKGVRIFAMLHGQTDLDAEGRIQGSSDHPLNEAGKNHAQNIAKALEKKGIDLIMAPPQKRAMETAEIIARHLGIEEGKIVKGMKLIERDFGDYEGKLISEIDFFALCSFIGNAPAPNGETIRETAVRVIPYMNNMMKLVFKEKTVLLVVPSHVLRVLFWYFFGLPEAGKESIPKTDSRLVYEFETNSIPPAMLDSLTIVSKLNPGNDQESGGFDRVLSQQEIDKLIAEMEAK